MSLEKEALSAVTDEPNFQPIRVVDIEISEPLPALPSCDPNTGRSYRRAIALVRLHAQPLGMVALAVPEAGLSAAACAGKIWQNLAAEINTHLRQDGLPPVDQLTAVGLPAGQSTGCRLAREAAPEQAPLVTISVATRDRAESLRRCLDSLLALAYPAYEIVVVDNAPNTAATSDLIQQRYSDCPQIRYVREERPGLSWARNRGLREAKGAIVAFTDDDVVVDARWLAELVKGFNSAANVACVTGLTVPAQLETQAQLWFEQFGGFGKGFIRKTFDTGTNRPSGPLFPYAAGTFGSGVNMAFKRSFLQQVGGFDPALGTGSPTHGGEDLAAFFQVISEGRQLVYEPGAIVYHWHRQDYAALRKQAYGYGVGLTAYLLKLVLDRPARIFDLLLKLPAGLVYALSSNSPKNAKKQADYPAELTKIERRGMLYGPLAYLKSRRQARRLGRRDMSQKNAMLAASRHKSLRDKAV